MKDEDKEILQDVINKILYNKEFKDDLVIFLKNCEVDRKVSTIPSDFNYSNCKSQ